MEFYQKFSPNLQALETMGKLKEINGYVRITRPTGETTSAKRAETNWNDDAGNNKRDWNPWSRR